MFKCLARFAREAAAFRVSAVMLAAVVTLLMAPPSRAQQTSSTNAVSSSASSAGTLQEIVVTAEKRTESIQSAPLSVTAYTGAQLQAAGISDMTEVGYETPGVSERNSGPGQTEYEMRGIASSGGESPTVGFYLDDTPLTPPEEALLGKVVIDPSLYDLNRVEILRGPQGTLYGSGSMGGTIKLVTNQPDPTAFAVTAQTVASDTKDGGFNYGVNGMVNIPLVADKLALRIVGTDSYTDGWINRVVASPFPYETNGGLTRGDVLSAPVEREFKDSNWAQVQGGRVALQWLPVDGLTITPSVFLQRVTQGAPNFVDDPPGVRYESHFQPFDVSEPYGDSFELFSLPIKYDIGGVELSSSSAYYRRQTHLSQDTSEVGQDFLYAILGPQIGGVQIPPCSPGVPCDTYAAAGAFSSFETDYTSQFSEELRVTSNGEGPFQWLAGFFYEDYKTNTAIGTTTPGPLVADLLGVPSLFYLTFDNDLKQYAGFGDASYKLPYDFKLTAGLRYYHYTSSEDLAESGGLISGPGPPFLFSLPASASGVNPKVNLSYEPTGDLTVYVQAAKGFRPGGGNPPPPVTCPSNPLQYDPDSIWSYEAGEKARLLNGRLTLNGAVYFEDWTGIQQLVTETCGATYVANAGTAHVYGGELEAAFNITQELTLTTAAGYTHAEVVQALAGTGFVDGERVQEVPDWTETTSIIYRHPISDDYDILVRATNEYIGTMTDVTYYLNQVPARDIVRARVGWVSDRKVSAYLFVDNLFDKRADLGDPEEISFFVPALNRVMTNQPRTIGLELSYAWGGKAAQ
jgi:outer membrane receptor protein involved in Fe transport